MIIKIDYDAHWKNITKKFLPQMLQIALPELAKDMDDSRDVEYLEQELNEVAIALGGPKRNADLLVKIPMKRSPDIWLALHVEIQGEAGGNLPERMFFYNAMLRAKYLKKPRKKKPRDSQEAQASDVVSLAILTAPRPEDEKPHYERISYSNNLRYEYPAIKLWEMNEAELAASANPFDWALLSGLYVIRSGDNDRARTTYLRQLGETLDSKGWSRDEKLALYRFTEAILRPKDDEMWTAYREWVDNKSKEGTKMYISVAEELGMERGMKKGIRKGMKKGLERGIEKGREEGTIKGIEQGARLAKLEIAKTLLSSGKSLAETASIVSLPEEDLIGLA